ncbi:MAG: hypothetical protein H6509_11580 [Bryobacterales bacterium]|nr:hypothetical protein [Acidobacteriota bacterium]MCB9385248.1 hypothetical protein [Bryobacterales bacterium]
MKDKIIVSIAASILTAAIFAALGWLGAIPNLLVPAGAIVGFTSTNCPAGWEPYEPAKGRVVVGALNASNTDETGSTITKWGIEQVGGEQSHQLSLSEMPKHSHLTVEAGDAINSEFGVGARGNARHGVKWQNPFERSFTSPVGGAQAHNNMPPFVALHFCQKLAKSLADK